MIRHYVIHPTKWKIGDLFFLIIIIIILSCIFFFTNSIEKQFPTMSLLLDMNNLSVKWVEISLSKIVSFLI